MWIPFIPLFVSGVMLKLYQAIFDPNGVNAGLLSGGSITIGFAVIVIAAFIILLLISASDKATSPRYEIKRNIPAGIFALLAAVFLIADAVTMFFGGINIQVLIDAVFSLGGAIGISVIGISSLTGENRAKSAPALMLLPALWGFARTFISFLNDTRISSESKDMSDIVFMAFATMFLFNCGMLYLKLVVKHAVKGSFVYGMMLILVSVAYTVSHTVYDLRNGVFSLSSYFGVYEFFFLSLFALFLLIELTRGMRERTRKEYEEAGIVKKKEEEEDEEEEYQAEFSLEEQSEDPLMRKAEQSMKSIDRDESDEIVRQLANGSIDDPEMLVNIREEYLDDDDEYTDAYAESDSNAPANEVDYDNEYPEDYDNDEVSDISGQKPEEGGNGSYDVDLNDINRLIDEITGDSDGNDE